MTIQQFHTNQLTGTVYDAVWFEALFNALDHLHDDVCADRLAPLPATPVDEMVGWLEDIVYTAKETILELRAAPGLVGKAEKLGQSSGGDHVSHNG